MLNYYILNDVVWNPLSFEVTRKNERLKAFYKFLFQPFFMKESVNFLSKEKVNWLDTKTELDGNSYRNLVSVVICIWWSIILDYHIKDLLYKNLHFFFKLLFTLWLLVREFSETSKLTTVYRYCCLEYWEPIELLFLPNLFNVFTPCIYLCLYDLVVAQVD